MVWLGVPVINLPTRVRYLKADEGGVSHFRMFRDNALISWVHTRLVTLRILRGLGLVARRRLP
jgi:polyprenyl-phospho-N-acetylgalactosaminyl synthase